jgi:hypothetical protein
LTGLHNLVTAGPGSAEVQFISAFLDSGEMAPKHTKYFSELLGVFIALHVTD